MGQLTKIDITNFIEPNIQQFHDRRLDSLRQLDLKKILRRKNPYLFKAKSQNSATDLIKTIIDAHLSSQEEAIFGSFLEQLAIYICEKSYGGRKSASEGIDLEFQKNDTFYLVSIKSGPNWGNSRQLSKMKDDFRKAKRILGANTRDIKVVAVNGCCYGRDDRPDKGDYLKYCGQQFWEFISGNPDLYIEIVEPLGHKAKEKNDKFLKEYKKVINKLTQEFEREYCASDGAILWQKLLEFNSGMRTESRVSSARR